jgi:hypothetical protein
MRLRRGETVPALASRTDSEFALRNCDHLRRPRCALGVPIPYSHSESQTRRCGCADHHGIELIARMQEHA